MIISHSKKFIFIKNVKTAGTSIEYCISKYLKNNDIFTPFGGIDIRHLNYVPKNYKTPTYTFDEHSSISFIYNNYDKNLIKNYYI